MNASGELIEKGIGNGKVKIGQNVAIGFYLLRVTQGEAIRVYKLVKE